jgi:hypothetical protein
LTARHFVGLGSAFVVEAFGLAAVGLGAVFAAVLFASAGLARSGCPTAATYEGATKPYGRLGPRRL